MARTLVLVRHAKAQGPHPQGDFWRELADKGRVTSVDLGRRLGEAGLRPDHVVASTAPRARQTLDGMLQGAGLDQDAVGVWRDRRVYDDGIDGTLEAIAETPGEAQILWVVGHEPVMSATAWELLDRESLPDDLREHLGSGLKTATAVALTIPDGPDQAWSPPPGAGSVTELIRGVEDPDPA